MWNKREETPAPRPATAPPAPPAPAAEIRKEPVPVSTTPYRAPEADARNTATIGKNVKINGQIIAREDLYVDGDVEGTIESQDNKVTIGPSGRVQAGIRAREVIILGQVQGNVEAADKVDIRKEAKLVGDIVSARISIEDGAQFKGSIDIRKPEVKAQVSAPVVTAPPPSVASTPQPAAAPPVAPAASTAAGGMKR
jgi:cytoskeletal protein CcmA (bactofilin family)